MTNDIFLIVLRSDLSFHDLKGDVSIFAQLKNLEHLYDCVTNTRTYTHAHTHAHTHACLRRPSSCALD